MISIYSSLTPRQGVVVAGRVLCVFFLFWSLCNLSGIPSMVIALIHYQHHGEGAIGGSYYSYWSSRYVASISGAVLRAVIELWVAGIFYRCGPRVARFLLGDDGQIAPISFNPED